MHSICTRSQLKDPQTWQPRWCPRNYRCLSHCRRPPLKGNKGSASTASSMVFLQLLSSNSLEKHPCTRVTRDLQSLVSRRYTDNYRCPNENNSQHNICNIRSLSGQRRHLGPPTSGKRSSNNNRLRQGTIRSFSQEEHSG